MAPCGSAIAKVTSPYVLTRLTNDQVYAVSAYILAANEIIPKDAVLDSAAVMAIQMPAKDRFVPDDRRGGPEVK